MAKVSFTLDGVKVETEVGSTILEAARQNGVEIPTLCHDPRLEPYAACRICLVEVEGARNPLPACITPVAEGMVVRTKTDDIIALRHMGLELLLSDHYGDCVAPCKRACPAGIDIQGYIALIANGLYKEAVKLIKESNPLPAVCGRVCPRFCEQKCRRNLVDEPVAINALKRFVADYDLNNGSSYTPEVKPPTGHKVAIVGGGPAGLSAAYYLALEGHEVTIFEANPQLGGMLRYGIPQYRLPKEELDKEIATIVALCSQIRCNISLGRDFTIESLKRDGYESVFIALGAQAEQRMRVEGEELEGIFSGLQFLRDAACNREIMLGQKVAVIGGGNTAVDAARTALRLGAQEVSIVYRRSAEEMPASDEEIEQAQQEGVEFQFLAAPFKLKGDNGRVASMECIRMALGEPDSSGRRRPVPIEGSNFHMPVDAVIAAIGQNLDTSSLDGQIELTPRRCVKVDEGTMETTREGIFAGGDCVSGPATVVEAIAAGRKAALSINQYLSGQPITSAKEPFNCSKGELDEIDVAEYADVARIPRTEMPALDPEERKDNFSEIELGFTEEMAQSEAQRCLACGCQAAFDCSLRTLATEYGVSGDRFAGCKHRYPIRKDEHPFIIRDPNKCILCARCVRICHEIQGVSVLGFVNRGFDTIIQPSLSLPLSETACESCGQCVSTCPTGALTAKSHLPKSGPWELNAIPTVCPYCGIGCNIELNVIGDKVAKVTSPIGNSVNDGNLCQKGSFSYLFSQDLGRVTTPLIKRDERLIKATWDEAIAMASEGLRQIRERSRGQRVAVLSSPDLTNEENYLAQKLARMALGTNNIGSLTPFTLNDSLAKSFGKNASTCSFNDILNSDLVLVFGCDLATDYPIIASKVGKAVGNGSKLIMINPWGTRLDPLAKITLRVNPRTTLGLLQGMLNYIISYDLVDHSFVQGRTVGLEKLAKRMRRYPLEKVAETLWVKLTRVIEAIHFYIRAERPVIIVDGNTITPTELTLLNDLALTTGNVGRDGAGIIALHSPGNIQGLLDMGVSPDYLPGQQPITKRAVRRIFTAAWHKPLPQGHGKNAVTITEGMKTGETEGIVIIGSDAIGKTLNGNLQAPLFSVVIAPLSEEALPDADVILPGATFAETEGTFTNCERRIQRLHRAVPPPGGKENWEIIAELATALGYPMHYPSVSSIFDEMASLVPLLDAIKYDEMGEEGRQWPYHERGSAVLYGDGFSFEDGLARLRHAELEHVEVVAEAVRNLARASHPV